MAVQTKLLYNTFMSLYWKEIEIVPGMLLAVELFQYDVLNSNGAPAAIQWKILSFGSRNCDEAYIDYTTGKKYSMKRVIKKKKLQIKAELEELLQLPAGRDFMIVQVYHDEEAVYKRCYSLDMLQTIRNIRVIDFGGKSERFI